MEKEIYKKWKELINMSAKEIQEFLDSDYGKEAGLSREEARHAGAGGKKITSGRDSARAIIRMLGKKFEDWTPDDYKWAKKQINFISRMRGVDGPLFDEKNRPTRKHLALKVWGRDESKVLKEDLFLKEAENFL